MHGQENIKICSNISLISSPLFPSLTRNLMFVRCSNSSSDILAAAHQNTTQTVIDATQKETAIDQPQQHSCETLILCQSHQTILRLLSSAAATSTQWRVRELNCPTTYVLYLYELGGKCSCFADPVRQRLVHLYAGCYVDNDMSSPICVHHVGRTEHPILTYRPT